MFSLTISGFSLKNLMSNIFFPPYITKVPMLSIRTIFFRGATLITNKILVSLNAYNLALLGLVLARSNKSRFLIYFILLAPTVGSLNKINISTSLLLKPL